MASPLKTSSRANIARLPSLSAKSMRSSTSTIKSGPILATANTTVVSTPANNEVPAPRTDPLTADDDHTNAVLDRNPTLEQCFLESAGVVGFEMRFNEKTRKFSAELLINKTSVATGVGKSKKDAQAEARAMYLAQIKGREGCTRGNKRKKPTVMSGSNTRSYSDATKATLTTPSLPMAAPTDAADCGTFAMSAAKVSASRLEDNIAISPRGSTIVAETAKESPTEKKSTVPLVQEMAKQRSRAGKGKRRKPPVAKQAASSHQKAENKATLLSNHSPSETSSVAVDSKTSTLAAEMEMALIEGGIIEASATVVESTTAEPVPAKVNLTEDAPSISTGVLQVLSSPNQPLATPSGNRTSSIPALLNNLSAENLGINTRIFRLRHAQSCDALIPTVHYRHPKTIERRELDSLASSIPQSLPCPPQLNERPTLLEVLQVLHIA